MEDEKIVALYWERNEAAISATEEKYGRYLTRIAYNILADHEDSEESVNDTYLRAWNSMPPHRPCFLSTYLGKITREVSIDRFRRRNREKRRPSQYALSLSELEECIPDNNRTEAIVDLHLLAGAINAYLYTLRPEARNVFVGRYYFMDSIREITAYYGMSESRVKSILHRARKGLRQFLIREGFDL